MVIISATIGAILVADPILDALQRVWPFSFARLGAEAKGVKDDEQPWRSCPPG